MSDRQTISKEKFRVFEKIKDGYWCRSERYEKFYVADSEFPRPPEIGEFFIYHHYYENTGGGQRTRYSTVEEFSTKAMFQNH